MISILNSPVEAAGNSLFKVEHMAPGDSVSKEVTVYNDDKVKKKVRIWGVRKAETGYLSQVLSISIADKSQQLYGGRNGMKTISQFFSESTRSEGILLSTIPARTKKIYRITVVFLPKAGNEFQSKKLTFDFKIEPFANEWKSENKKFR